MESNLGAGLSYALACLGCGDLQLKEKQVEAIRCVYEGKDVFIGLPTGYGKFICFHCLPFLFNHKLGRVSLPPNRHSVCLIVSPLIFNGKSSY